jgi:adenylate cyclase
VADPDGRRFALGAPTLVRRQVSRAAGVSLLSARRFWRALGFPLADEDEPAFSQADVEALHRVVQLVRDGHLDESTALGLTRAIGRSVERMASWQVQVLAEHVAARAPEHAEGPAPAARTAHDTAELFSRIADDLEPLVLYAWRRQAASALERVLADAPPDAAGDDQRSAMVRAVGFADLVQFTRLARRLSERELAAVVQRFEVLVSDVITAHGGRVVKTVGDEVMFAASPGPAAAAIALGVAEALRDDELLPDVRVGLATGPVVARLGDLFGTTVNRASRLTAIARPGTVLVDVGTVHSLAGVPDLEVLQLRGRTLRGMGTVVRGLGRRPAPHDDPGVDAVG